MNLVPVVCICFFFCNYQSYYVGLATENIVDSLSKHIVKVFGSYVGVGVNHTDERIKGEKIQIVLEGHRGEESIAEENKAEILTIKKGLEACCL